MWDKLKNRYVILNKSTSWLRLENPIEHEQLLREKKDVLQFYGQRLIVEFNPKKNKHNVGRFLVRDFLKKYNL